MPAIVESLREFGQHRPLVVRKEDDVVIAGNHVLEAARVLGWTHVDCFYVDDDEAKAMRRALADNAVSDLSTFDNEQLASMLAEAEWPEVPGIDEKMVEKLRKQLEPEPDDEGPIYPITPRIGEQYGYVVLVATNAVDLAWLETTFGVRTEQSYKSEDVGVSRVVTLERLREEGRI